MAFSLNIQAGPLSLSVLAQAGHLYVFWGQQDRGFVLESGHGPNDNGKVFQSWRNEFCGSLNVAAFGWLLVGPGRAAQVQPAYDRC